MAALKYYGELSKGELWQRNQTLHKILLEKDAKIRELQKQLAAEREERRDLTEKLFEYELSGVQQ